MSKASETRDYIIAKAAPIFNSYGYAGTSMSQLTRAIGMTKGAIYGNFKDKDEIALAAFDYNFTRIKKETRRIIQSRENACDKLTAFANFYLDRFSTLAATGGCPVLNAAVDADDVHPLLKQRVAAAIDEWLGTIIHIINTGIKHKQVNPKVKPEQFASIFVSLIEGGIMLSKTTGNAIHLSRNVDHLIHLINSELGI